MAPTIDKVSHTSHTRGVTLPPTDPQGPWTVRVDSRKRSTMQEHALRRARSRISPRPGRSVVDEFLAERSAEDPHE